MRASIAAAVACACTFSAHAQDVPTFPTIDAAATAALSAVLPKSACQEWGGLIVTDGERYTFTPAQPGTEGALHFSVRLHKGQHVAGIYHTHPSCHSDGSATEAFSSVDVDIADHLQVPSYIGVYQDESVRRYSPGGPPSIVSFVLGSIIAHIAR